MPVLSEVEIAAALEQLPAWSHVGNELVATFRRASWSDALALVNAIGEEAEQRNHHPDVCITGYRTVTLRLSTHSAGGVTRRDIALASWINRAAGM